MLLLRFTLRLACGRSCCKLDGGLINLMITLKQASEIETHLFTNVIRSCTYRSLYAFWKLFLLNHKQKNNEKLTWFTIKQVHLCKNTTPKFLLPLFQNDAKGETFHVKKSFNSLANKTHFHIQGFPHGFTLKQRQKAT